MSKSTWTGAVSSDWDDADNWSPAGVPGAGSDVTIATGEAVASASIGTVNSITDSSDLRFRSAGTNTVTAFLDNSGELRVDRKGGAGGTILNIAGTLTNSGSLIIGNATLSASDAVTAASLDNTGGEIRLLGSGANQALLDVSGSAGFGAAGVLSGTVSLAGDSAIEFKSGEITSLQANAQLHLVGSHACVEDSTGLRSSSALTGLASIGAGGWLDLQNGASVSTDGALANDGALSLDTAGGDGGSSLTVGGTLTNDGASVISIGSRALSASDEMTATSLDNTGFIQLTGSGANQALLDVSGSAGFGTAGVLSGTVFLVGDSAIEFVSGQITSLTGILDLVGKDAFIEDSTAPGSNSALAGLTSIGDGVSNVSNELVLERGASVSTTGALDNDGGVYLDSLAREGGSSLTVVGTLTNIGSLNLGNPSLRSSDSVTANSLVNSGTVNLTSNGTNVAALDVSGATTNNGSISIASDTEELAGAVRGKGSFSLSTASLQFDSRVSAGQTIAETGADALTLKHAQSFAGTISGFGTGDTIDAANFLLSGTTFNFVENSGGTGGTLTLHDGSLTANILMTGHYSNSSFTLAPFPTGTLVKFV